MADAIRVLSMDAVHKAKSGHQGMPMGMADVATVLWTKFLKYDAAQPDWADRDRFVLSAGHGSMLLYTLLHLTGVKAVTMEEIQQLPAVGLQDAGPPGVRPHAGRGDHHRAAGPGPGHRGRHGHGRAPPAPRFGDELVDHRTWVIAGDGCLMEGVSHEAISLAGRLKLNKLTVLFDDNNTTIDGEATISETGDQLARFKAAGWAVKAVDGHDLGKIAAALRWATRQDRPTLIACKTKISKGAGPKEGDPHSHGYTLFDDEIAAARARPWAGPHEPFVVPDEIAEGLARRRPQRGAKARKAWEAQARRPPPQQGRVRARHGRRPAGGRLRPRSTPTSPRPSADKPADATRLHSGAALETLIPAIPEMVGGSADLTGSNNTIVKGMNAFDAPDYAGRYVHYGVREFGMAAAMNGMALHGGVIPYSGTFLVFSDYSRPAIRLGALMGIRVDPRDDPRLHRPRRGRPDPPAGGAPGRPARHAEPAGLPPGRRGGGGRVLEAGAGGQDRRPRSWPCRARRRRPCAPQSPARTCRPAAPMSWPRAGQPGQGDDVRLRHRSRRRHGRPRAAGGRGHRRARGLHPLLGAVRRPARRLPGRGHRRDRRCGWPSRPACAGLGAVHRRGRRLRRHDRLRRQRPGRAALQEFGITAEAVVHAAMARL